MIVISPSFWQVFSTSRTNCLSIRAFQRKFRDCRYDKIFGNFPPILTSSKLTCRMPRCVLYKCDLSGLQACVCQGCHAMEDLDACPTNFLAWRPWRLLVWSHLRCLIHWGKPQSGLQRQDRQTFKGMFIIMYSFLQVLYATSLWFIVWRINLKLIH